jgi:AmmeMemoRadiSam system protein B
MKTAWALWGISLLALIFSCGAPAENQPAPKPDRPPVDKVRQPVDLVGFTHSAAGIEAVVALALEQEKHRIAKNAGLLGIEPDDLFYGAISPHDDYRYAMGTYVHLYPHIAAKHVIAIGVAHKALRFPETEGKLVFDRYQAWHGPYGPVPISPLRAELLARLDKKDALVHDELQRIEHSVEALIPFLQYYNKKVQITPILVPYMPWERLAELASRTAAALAGAMEEKGLILGQDVAILISSDSIHYGDQGWNGAVYADFGVDQAGYDAATRRELEMIDEHLVGDISLDRLGGLFQRLVAKDYHEYDITWCGRFSIPFGVALLGQLPVPPGRLRPRGVLLRYATTLDPGPTDPGVAGLGFTAEASLRHWVGFAAIGFL